MKTIAIIPARYQSTRFPGKPLSLVAGVPMVERVYQRAKQIFDHVYVATDDSRIQDAVRSFGGQVVMTNPNHQSGTDRVAEAQQLIEQATGHAFDVVVNIQGDEPFVESEHLTKIVALFDNPKTDIATLVKPFGPQEEIFNTNSPKVVVDTQGRALMFSREAIPHIRGVDKALWSEKHIYLKHIGMYGYRSEVLRQITQLPQSDLELCESLEQLRWLENGYSIYVDTTHIETLAIDTPEDLERANAMFL